jgi:pimeloyl-ACP methyl ester carboxylesterase
METITSADGTRIAFWRSGVGPPLLLVHGASYDHATAWRFVVPELGRRFTVYAVDRRGRGASKDAPAYELQREAEDVAAVAEAIAEATAEPVNLLGHSYGALCAVEAALLTPNLRRLILYEGVPLNGADYYPPGMIEQLEALLQAGDLEGMLITMMREVIQRPPQEIELLRSHREDWVARLRNAPTIPREMRGEQGYVFAPERFSNMRTPTLLLVGGDSPPSELRNARGVSGALTDAQVVVMPGQRHIAMITAPENFVREILQFLEP